jgi:hypothetical protein
MWILRGRDSILGGLGVERGERYKIGRWIGVGIWGLVVFLACLGGWVAEKVELIGVTATLAVGWLLPCRSRRHSPRSPCSCILHHNLPRKVTIVDCIPISQSSSIGCHRPKLSTSIEIPLSHGQLDGSFGRCALGEKRATASEETFGKETLAGSDSLRGYSARRRDHHGLEHRELLWILVRVVIVKCIVTGRSGHLTCPSILLSLDLSDLSSNPCPDEEPEPPRTHSGQTPSHSLHDTAQSALRD